MRELLDEVRALWLEERSHPEDVRDLECLGRERGEADEGRAGAGRLDRGGGPGRGGAAAGASEGRIEAEEPRALLVAGVARRSRVAVEVPAGESGGDRAAERVAAAEHLAPPHPLVRDLLGENRVPVAHRLLEADVVEELCVRGALPAAEAGAADLLAAPVV